VYNSVLFALTVNI